MHVGLYTCTTQHPGDHRRQAALQRHEKGSVGLGLWLGFKYNAALARPPPPGCLQQHEKGVVGLGLWLGFKYNAALARAPPPGCPAAT